MIIYFNEYLDELLMQEDLLDILPMVEEANAISQELDRKVIIRQLLICQLVVRARQLASVVQLGRALESQGHRFDSCQRTRLWLHFSQPLLVTSNKCIKNLPSKFPSTKLFNN